MSSSSFPFLKFLTIRIGRVHLQRLQGICTCVQKESHALHPEEVHIAKTKSAKEGNHVLHKILPRETREDQPPSQWGCREGEERWVSCTLPFILGERIMKLEVLEVWKEADEIQDLLTRATWLPEGEESKRWREVTEAPLDVWRKAGYLEIVYSELLEVRECGKVTQRTSVELVGSEHGAIGTL